jgi:lysophospholipase L1-like esterase
MRLTYVALGDSFSAGAAAGGAPGFADRLAELLAAARYDNLAEPGATTADVVDRQLAPAIALAPDVVTVVCGGNDALLAVRPDPDAHAAGVDRLFATLTVGLPEARVATATTPDPARFLGLRPRSAARVGHAIALINQATRTSARRHGVALVDIAAHPDARDRGNYGADGYHPSPVAAERTAGAFAWALGVDPHQQQEAS